MPTESKGGGKLVDPNTAAGGLRSEELSLASCPNRSFIEDEACGAVAEGFGSTAFLTARDFASLAIKLIVDWGSGCPFNEERSTSISPGTTASSGAGFFNKASNEGAEVFTSSSSTGLLSKASEERGEGTSSHG